MLSEVQAQAFSTHYSGLYRAKQIIGGYCGSFIYYSAGLKHSFMEVCTSTAWYASSRRSSMHVSKHALQGHKVIDMLEFSTRMRHDGQRASNG